MRKSNKELVYFSVYGGFIFSLIGEYWKFGLFCWFLGIIIFSFMFLFLFITYLVIRRAVLFIYENYIRIFPEVLREDEKKELKKKQKYDKQI